MTLLATLELTKIFLTFTQKCFFQFYRFDLYFIFGTSTSTVRLDGSSSGKFESGLFLFRFFGRFRSSERNEVRVSLDVVVVVVIAVVQLLETGFNVGLV